MILDFMLWFQYETACARQTQTISLFKNPPQNSLLGFSLCLKKKQTFESVNCY